MHWGIGQAEIIIIYSPLYAVPNPFVFLSPVKHKKKNIHVAYYTTETK